MTSAAADRFAAETWFLRKGLPAVLRPGGLLRNVWSRSAPALAAFAVMMAVSIAIVLVTGSHTIDIDGAPTRSQWFELAMVVLVLPTAALVGRAVSRIARRRTRAAVAAVSVAVITVGAAYGGPFALRHFDVILNSAIIAAILLATATGIGSILGWALRMTLENLASMGALLVRALPVMLLTVLVFFNGPVWTMAATVGPDRLEGALLFLLVIAGTFLVSTTVNRVRPTMRREAAQPDRSADLAGTPFAELPDPAHIAPLTLPERVNGVIVIALSQTVQVMTAAAATGLLFFIFGLILISPELLRALTNGGSADGHLLGMTLPVPQALIHVVMFLTTLTFMYLAARAVSDDEYRADFVDPLLDDLHLTLLARNRYRADAATPQLPQQKM
ncbi:hypothetical protein ABIA30_005281 [Mycobacterium sp. MAA66]|uniref:hypothetical protein n=1 Tax=Mycobacterium sp. MAA66 TaxID=3156297 RepID=UPI0035160C0A